MSQDPIADMLTSVRNAHARGHDVVTIPSSKIKIAIAEVLKNQGYIRDYKKTDDAVKPQLAIALKYYQGKPVIDTIKRVSKPSLRIYRSYKNMPNVLDELGIAIVSTSKGVMPHISARKQKLGGEILCTVE